MQENFLYKKGPFELTTINRQHTFYYRLTKPIEIWGNYHTQIAFYDQKNDLVYHRKNYFAHALNMNNSLEFVKWSDTGGLAMFYEYRRGHIENDGIYHYLIVDLFGKVAYRINLYRYNHSFLDDLQNGFEATEIIKQIQNIGIEKEPCHKDKIIISPLKWLTGIDRWAPVARL